MPGSNMGSWRRYLARSKSPSSNPAPTAMSSSTLAPNPLSTPSSSSFSSIASPTSSSSASTPLSSPPIPSSAAQSTFPSPSSLPSPRDSSLSPKSPEPVVHAPPEARPDLVDPDHSCANNTVRVSNSSKSNKSKRRSICTGLRPPPASVSEFESVPATSAPASASATASVGSRRKRLFHPLPPIPPSMRSSLSTITTTKPPARPPRSPTRARSRSLTLDSESASASHSPGSHLSSHDPSFSPTSCSSPSHPPFHTCPVILPSTRDLLLDPLLHPLLSPPHSATPPPRPPRDSHPPRASLLPRSDRPKQLPNSSLANGRTPGVEHPVGPSQILVDRRHSYSHSNDICNGHPGQSTTMQQIECMSDSHQQSTFPRHQRSDGRLPEASAGAWTSAAAPTSASSSAHMPPLPRQKRTLSSKRMRPPLAEISTASLSSSTLAAALSGIIHDQCHTSTAPTQPLAATATLDNHNSAHYGSPDNIDMSRIAINQYDHKRKGVQQAHGPSLPPADTLPYHSSLTAGLSTMVTHTATSTTAASTALSMALTHPEGLLLSAASTSAQTTQEHRIPNKRVFSRSHLSRDAKALRTRIRKLWQDPSQAEHYHRRSDPKNNYILLEDALTGMLQIVPPIIQNSRPQNVGLHLPSPISLSELDAAGLSFSSTTNSPATVSPAHLHSRPSRTPSNPTTKSSSASPPSSPVRTRARTTSSNSASTISATRYQIATSILQPQDPTLTDVHQSAVRTPSNIATLGEPSLSTIANAAITPIPGFENKVDPTHPRSNKLKLQESNQILISKLLSLASTFTGAIKSLCEQQNEKVLRFDDDMILDLLLRWEQEAGHEDQEPSAQESSGMVSLVTLGATNALERYQITVGRVWEEADMILSIIRKIRDLVEFGRVQHDFADSDSEEDAVVQDEAVKKNLYSTLLFHANGLVTLLGEFLESVSSIQRLVGSIKSKANDLETKALPRPPSEQVVPELIPESTPSVGSFLIDEPRPVKHLDPAMIRKLKRKTPFKAMAEKVRRSFSDFAKKSTHSLLTIFPPLGDGTNEGFHWDSYSDGEYDSEEWQTTEMSSSHIGFEDSFVRSALATPISPSTVSEKRRSGHHRRLSSKDSAGLPDQYWPGSIKLGQLDEMIGPARPAPPHPLSALSYDMNRDMFQDRIVDPRLYSTNTRLSSESRRESVQLGLEMHDTKRRDSVQTQAFTTASSSSSLLTPTRPFSTVSSGSDSYSPSRNNYKVRPPLPPAVLPSLPPSPTQSFFMAEEMMQETTSLQRKAANRTSLYLATRHSPPYQHAPLILDSPFTRQTIIRMGSDRNRYSVRMPSDDVAREPSITMTTRSFPASFWRRRSMNDNVERGWNLMRRRGSLVSATSGPSNPSSLSTPLSPEFDKQSKASVTLSSFEFAVPLFPRENSVRESRQSLEEGRGSTRPSLSMELSGNRRHSCPLSSSAEMALDEALSRRQSLSSQHTAAAATAQSSRSQDSTEQGPKRAVMESTPLPMTMADPSSMTDSLETMSSPLRPRLPPKAHSHSHYQRLEGGHGGSADVNSPETQAQDAALVARRPVSTSRFGDMKRAWEILNLDVKRVNQYSHLRAYARAYTQQNNHWALNHPNALQSSTSPQVLHICQNGVDVLVMEMFTDHLQVVAGQLDKLIERLADENAQDGEYVSCFLLSHSFFIDSEDLLDRLIARFHIQPRQGEILYFQKWHTVIQCKVLCVLHRWIQLQYEDFELNPNLLKTVKKFLEVDVRRCGFANEAEYIQENISIKSRAPLKNCSVIMEQGRFCLQRTRTRKMSLTRAQNLGQLHSPTSPQYTLSEALQSIPSTPEDPTDYIVEYGPPPELAASSPILKLESDDLAKYLTLADMKAFRTITIFELMSGWWKRRQVIESKQTEPTSSGMGTRAGHAGSGISGLSSFDMDGVEDGAIEAFTRRANMLSYWVAHEIVSTAGAKPRKQLLKKFIEVAKICRSLNNLHTTMFIVSALSSAPVRRLSASWKLLSSRDMETLKELEKLLDISNNMRYYRQAMAEAEAPTIPFLPILLKDITFILDGNQTMISSRANSSPASKQESQAPATGETTNGSLATPTVPVADGSTQSKEKESATNKEEKSSKSAENMLINFDKFRRLTQYVENAVDMAKSVDYWFEHKLLRQARVFRPLSPSMNNEVFGNDGESAHGHGLSPRHSQHQQMAQSSLGHGSPADGVRGELDHISEIVERRLVKASGLYGPHQRLVEVVFSTKAKSSQGGGLWSGNNIGGSGGSGSSIHGSGSAETVIRTVQGEEEYLMGLSLLCEPAR